MGNFSGCICNVHISSFLPFACHRQPPRNHKKKKEGKTHNRIVKNDTERAVIKIKEPAQIVNEDTYPYFSNTMLITGLRFH